MVCCCCLWRRLCSGKGDRLMVGAELRKVERARIAGLVGARVARLARVNVRSEAASRVELVTAIEAEGKVAEADRFEEAWEGARA